MEKGAVVDVRPAMDEIVAGLPTKAAMIRALAPAGYSRSEIAKYLGISYQHVRNVLVRPAPKNVDPEGGKVADARPAMDEIVAGLPTKSAKIRALDTAGYSRSEIAKYLEIRYQHVRNVLVQTKPEHAAGYVPERVRVKIGPSGRIVIPAPYRKALGVKEGDVVTLQLEGDEVRVISPAAAIRRAQDLIAKYVPADVSLVDELIAERRREAAREAAGE